MTEIETTLRRILAEHLCIEPDFPAAQPLAELGFDSLDAVEVAMEIEEHYDIDLDDAQIQQGMTTLAALVEVVEGANA